VHACNLCEVALSPTCMLSPLLYVNMQSTPFELVLKDMCDVVQDWALVNGLVIADDPAVCISTEFSSATNKHQKLLLNLFEKVGESKAPVFILIDELQHFFLAQHDNTGQPACHFFKDLVSPSRRHGNVYFVLTGSSMYSAWQGFALAGPEGHTISCTRVTLSIPINQSTAVAAVTQKLLRDWWSNIYSSTLGQLPDDVFATRFSEQPAYASYMVVLYSLHRDVTAAQQVATDELLSQCIDDIAVLHRALHQLNSKYPKLLRQLATCGCTVDPEQWLSWYIGASYYLDAYIQHDGAVWRLVDSPYSYMLAYILNKNGSMRDI
jgi:hypothetical protein